MDNDLMARRLRPPSEPISSLPPTGPMPPPSWMQQAPEQPQMPAARDEVPWDRPSDFSQPTDTASGADAAWDRPDTQPWDDSAIYDDRTAELFDEQPEPEVYRAAVAAATASELAVAEAVAAFAPAQAKEAQTSAVAKPIPAWSADDAANDLDDAFAPVLDDVNPVSAVGWHEPVVQAEVASDTNGMVEQTDDFWAKAWQSEPVATAETPTWQSEPAATPETPTWQSEPAATPETPTWQSEPAATPETPTWQSEPAATPETPTWQSEPAATPETPTWQSEPAAMPETPTWQSEPAAMPETPTWQSEPAAMPETQSWQSEPAVTAESQSWQSEPGATVETPTWQSEPAAMPETQSWQSEPVATVETPTWQSEPAATPETQSWQSEPATTPETPTWQSEPVATPETRETSSFSPVEPSDLAGRGLGPTPPANLFTEAASLWSAPPVEEASVEAEHEAPTEETYGQELEFDSDDDETTVGVTAEQPWQAYEAFAADQQPDQQSEAKAEDTSQSAAVLEIEVPQLAPTASADGGKPQQLVLRIELAIVDSIGRRVDPANVAVRISQFEPTDTTPAPVVFAAEPAQPQPEFVPEPQVAVVAEELAFDEPPWPNEVQSAVDLRIAEPSRWMEPDTTAPGVEWPPTPVTPAEPITAFASAAPTPPPVTSPAGPPEPVFGTLPPWTQQPQTQDPLSSLSAPPPPQTHQPAREPAPPTYTPPAFAPPTYGPPSGANRVDPQSATTAATSEAVVAPMSGEQREPHFRAPPRELAGDGGGGAATATAPGATGHVALWTLGVGVLVVILVLGFLRLMTNIL